jgi:hypothetical protein
MKLMIFLILLLFTFPLYSQQDTLENRIVISQEVRDCIDNIYDNPDALKALMRRLMSDKQNMRRIHKEFMNDPQMKEMMKEMRSEMDMDHPDDHRMMNHEKRDTVKQNHMHKK